MADIDNLMNFLQKEIPSNANDLNNSINNTLEIIERTRAALSDKYMSIAKNYFKDNNSYEIISNFKNADKQLGDFQHKLHNFLDNNIEDVIISDNTLIEENDNEDVPEDENEEIEEREGKIDYKKYLVDNTKPYPLSSDFENTTPDSFSFKGEKQKVKTYKEMWLKLCEILYNKDTNKFKDIATWHQIKGHKKAYIVYANDKIAQNITKPLRFMNTGIILEGTTSTTQKIKIMIQMLDFYKISHSSVKIYLKSDRHPRHGQEPIGIYKDKTYDYKVEINANLKNDNSNEYIVNNSNASTGKRVYNYLQDYFKDTSLSYDIQNLLDKNWCKKTFNISYPLLKEINELQDLKEQSIPEGKKGAYYAQNPILHVNNKSYIIYMQWNKMHRVRVEKWISENPVSISSIDAVEDILLTKAKNKCIHYDFKKDLCGNVDNPLFNQPCDNASYCKYYSEREVYITSKDKMKNKQCLCCGNSSEYKHLEVTYAPDNESSSIKKLQILRCNYCNKDFINVDLYRSYIKNKNPDHIDVKFVEFENNI